MSRLEERLKPTIKKMLENRQVKLSAAEQLDLGFWATLKAYVFDADRKHPLVSQDERDILYQQRRPPANVRVFLAASAVHGRFQVDRRHVTGYRSAGDSHTESAHATTLTLNHLVLQVLGATATDYRAFERLGVADDRVQTVVPPIPGGAFWPPAAALDESTLEQFATEHFSVRDDS